MIIFGLATFSIFGLIGTGQFHCPNCGGDRAYEHRVARRFFTLFFVPVIPLNKVGEFVRCNTCRTRFDPAVCGSPRQRSSRPPCRRGCGPSRSR